MQPSFGRAENTVHPWEQIDSTVGVAWEQIDSTVGVAW